MIILFILVLDLLLEKNILDEGQAQWAKLIRKSKLN